ncbi:SMP-30/gluconolactonase/LRE family protein [Variovorax sp. J22P271]|uniref:SMP-30/gluconolactonase/LRE family protein n=1 Tax=Variovorax davisae TaxID=3053515 RepID=UPI0025756550|nr:SMP-30/gluconolactonase/LRE family protein [Variovorax sp. J22P271]MDM0032407.1 SMP-30/gluconolactonase/LRE family protein [Variovorax sp. J22P271]
MQASLFADGFTWPESPRWHAGALYLSDCYNFRVVKVVPGSAPFTVAQVPGRPSGLAFFPDGRLIVAGAVDRKLWWVLPSGDLELAVDLSSLATGQLNDMVVDACGRVWVGDTGFVMEAGETPKSGRLFSWTPGSEPRIAANEIMFANGLAITPDGRTLYINESFANRISAFDLSEDGELKNRRVHAKLPNGPDGLCLDAEGALWVAILFDRTFMCIGKDGVERNRLVFDKELAVACVFGGDDRKTLFLAVAENDFASSASVPVGRIVQARPSAGGAGLP